MVKQTKVVSKRKKFVKVDIPIIRSKIELLGNSPSELVDRTIKLDLTRQLKGKSVEAIVKIKLEDDSPVAYPIKIKLMPYFIRRMIRKRISYVEDSFLAPSQENMLLIKPFLITRKRVSRAVRKTLRNKARNWIEDYVAERKNDEIFNEILMNRLQRPLSLTLKKTYPLSLCEIRILEIKRELEPNEIPKITKKPEKQPEQISEGLDQFKELEIAKQQAELKIKETQEKATKLETKSEEKESKPKTEKESKTKKESEPKTEKKESKPKTEKDSKTKTDSKKTPKKSEEKTEEKPKKK